MIIYKKPDFNKAQERAYETIINAKITTLPINLKQIIRQFDNLHLMKYSTFAWQHGMTIQEVCELLNSEDGCLWRREDDQYIILYNDTVESKERIRFTIAHEIGHFVLGHLNFSGKTKISRYTLNDIENDAFEKEANYFAKRLLAPLPLVYDFAYLWRRISYDLIMDIFDVSYTVSSYIIGDLNRAKNYGIIREIHKVSKQFKAFIKQVKHSLWCNNCNYKFSCLDCNHCPVCGENNLVNDSLFFFRRFNEMKYPGVELDNEMKAKQCPRCENEEIIDDYCKICGTYLFNICTGLDPSENYGIDYQFTRWDNFEGGCENLLDGNARFCTSCGSTSSFFEEGLLMRWDESKTQNINMSSINNFTF